MNVQQDDENTSRSRSPLPGIESGALSETERTMMELAGLECFEYVGAVTPPTAQASSIELLGDSFAGIVERYQTPLISFLYGMVGNHEQAEDLAQDTLIKAYEAMKRRHAGQQFSSGWLFRIARNTALDSLRRKRLISWLPFGVEHERVLPRRGDFAGQLAERELVQQTLACLPARYRECLLLRTVTGMSNTEIAEALGLSARNVNTTLFRARERFRRVYQELAGAAPRLARISDNDERVEEASNDL